jgi:glycosyltransferase involved in cell wall biosynthesis
MKLLVISHNPARASFRQRVAVYLDTLRKNNVTCEVAKLPSGSLARRKLFKRIADFDGVFLHKKRLNLVDAFWLRRYGRKVIYDFDDAVMYDDKHPEKLSRKRQKSFQRTVELADVVTAGNAYLAEHARRFNPNVVVLPTGLDTSAYELQTLPKKDDRIRLVWIGSKSTLPYLAEIRPVLEELGSRFENVVLRIICDDFFELRNMEVEKHQWSLEKQAVDLVTSDIGLAPLPDNRFTRGKCGFKVLQYAAAGLPVVASPVGVNSDYVKDGIAGLFAKDTRGWTDGIAQLTENSQLRKKMGHAGRNMVQDFDIAVLGKRLVNLIEKTLET